MSGLAWSTSLSRDQAQARCSTGAKFAAEVFRFSGAASPGCPHLRDLARHQSAVSGDDGEGSARSLILHEGLESLEWPCAAMMTMAVVVVAAAAAALVEVGQVRSERTSRAPVCDVTR